MNEQLDTSGCVLVPTPSTATPIAPSRSNRPAVASVALRPVLTGPPRAVRELARFSQALYLDVDDRSAEPVDAPVIALLGPDAVAVPGGLQLLHGDHRWPAAPVTGTVGDGRLTIDGGHVVVHRWWDPVPRLGPTTPVALVARAGRIAGRLPAAPGGSAAAGLLASFERVLAALASADDAAATDAAVAMLGLGPGLTPSGDDLLAGLLASIPPLSASLAGPGRHVARRVVAGRTVPDSAIATCVDPHPVGAARRLAVAVADQAPGRTTTVSAELLRHAATGAVARPVLRLLQALSGRGPVEPAVTELLAVGSSSGHDLCTGILGAVRLLTDGTTSHPIIRTLPRGP